MTRRFGAARARSDEGFTLIEAVMSIVMVALLLAAIAPAVVFTTRAQLIARQSQQAGDLMNQQLEAVRALPYGSIVMTSTDPTLTASQDSKLTTLSGNLAYDAGKGPEKLATSTTGASLINPHKTSVIRNNTTYTVYTYVTCPAELTTTCVNGTGVQYRRVTVRVSWSDHGKTHRRQDSTIVVNTRRGLPLPYYKFGQARVVAANVGGFITVPVFVTNLGAPDSWDLSTSAGSWTWYIDSDNNGALNTLTDTKISGAAGYDSNGNGKPETGRIESGSTLNLFAQRTATTSDIGTTTVVLTAQSVAQPSASSATQSFTDTIQTDPFFCNGCTSTKVWLHNVKDTNGGGNTCSTCAIATMRLDTASPTAASLGIYSSDVSAGTSGRYVLAGGGDPKTEASTSKMMLWRKALNNACTIPSGSFASIDIWAYPTSGGTGSFNVYVGSDTNTNTNGFITAGSQSMTVNSTPGVFKKVTVSVPITVTKAIAKNDFVEIKIQVPTSSVPMVFAYDVKTTYEAISQLPLAGTSCLG